MRQWGVHPLRLYRLPQRVGGGWWLSRIAGSQEIAAELMPGYEIGFNRSRRTVVGQFELAAWRFDPQAATVGSGMSATTSASVQTWLATPAATAGVVLMVW